jgi:hypothetical protein
MGGYGPIDYDLSRYVLYDPIEGFFFREISNNRWQSKPDSEDNELANGAQSFTDDEIKNLLKDKATLLPDCRKALEEALARHDKNRSWDERLGEIVANTGGRNYLPHTHKTAEAIRIMRQYAEKYQVSGNAYLYGAYLVTPPVTDAVAPEVELEVYSAGPDGGPLSLLYTKPFSPEYAEYSVADSNFVERPKPWGRGQETFVAFDRPVAVENAFFVAYKIKASGSSGFAVYNLPKGLVASNTAWLSLDGRWLPATEYPAGAFATSLFIDPVLRYTENSAIEPLPFSPSPVHIFAEQHGGGIFVDFRYPPTATAEFMLYDSGGKLLMEKSLKEDTHLSAPQAAGAGIYVAVVRLEGKLYTQKLYF